MRRNEMELTFDAIPENESLARAVAAFFSASCDPTMEQLGDIKTAVSEAVTNAIIHGYKVDCEDDKEAGLLSRDRERAAKENTECGENPKVYMKCVLEGNNFYTEIRDTGEGIENIQKAMEPMYTTMPEKERSGMGFSFMEAFMDELKVDSEPGKGTTVKMMKKLGLSAVQKENDNKSIKNP